MPDPYLQAPMTLAVTQITAPITLARDAYQLALAEGFDGTREEWLAYLASASDVYVSDTPPVDPTDGKQWLDSTDGTKSVYYADQDVWVVTGMDSSLTLLLLALTLGNGTLLTLMDGTILTL